MNVRGQGRLRLALPWLGAALAAAVAEGRPAVRCPAAEWLLARGNADAAGPSWREWLLEGVADARDLQRRCPPGPSIRALHTGEPPSGTWACARPVHLLTAIDHLQLAPGSLDLDASESSALLDDINRHFEERGFRFHAPSAGEEWSLECADAIDCSSVEPLDAAGRNLRGLLPAGRDGARICALMNELQMLLHEHPVNRDRAGRGRPAVNSFWLWGFGQLTESRTAILPALYADDAWLAGAWRLHGASARPLEQCAPGEARAGDTVLVGWSRGPEGEVEEALAMADRRLFSPARMALMSGAVRVVDLRLGGRAFTTDRGARLRFWRAAKPLAELLA